MDGVTWMQMKSPRPMEECLHHLLGGETKVVFQSFRGNRKEIAEWNEELPSSAKIFMVHLHEDFYLQNVIVDRQIVSGYVLMAVCCCCVRAHTCIIPRVIGTSVGTSGKQLTERQQDG